MRRHADVVFAGLAAAWLLKLAMAVTVPLTICFAVLAILKWWRNRHSGRTTPAPVHEI